MKISYHSEARGLAINVKAYHAADAEGGDDSQRMQAWEQAANAWWREAQGIAQKHGFKAAWACGRQGGWLYTDPLPEAADDESAAEYPPAFVADINALLKRAPELFADELANIIADAQETEEEAAQEAKDRADTFAVASRALHFAGFHSIASRLQEYAP
jgi:hypothetical protein